MSNPSLIELVEASQYLISQIAKHPDFLALDYDPDLTIGDAKTALTYLQSEIESNQKPNTASSFSGQE
ncbi:hypothetical protein H6G41_33730 [Tolypothrix sp. FACHB-123]|uniref:hypothetical protein n=1 Tax=Tolypothrix sp. FACHB-123 TaxID=2692868 RepID=UPI000BBBBF44|nr:hypothetical protein [Tolypothrix sp. FACHB-123]MBD2359474.1 hypothetical protein [Tolypothrix sp. FACHB-123]